MARPYLKPGERSVRMVTRVPESTRARAEIRWRQLGLKTEADWLRRLIENALLRVPSDALDDE